MVRLWSIHELARAELSGGYTRQLFGASGNGDALLLSHAYNAPLVFDLAKE